MKPKVSEILDDASKLFESRNAEYGNAYKSQAHIMHLLLGPIELKTVDDFERFTRISAMIAKLNRYAKNFEKGGHHDSARDLVVFAAMLQELHEDEAG